MTTHVSKEQALEVLQIVTAEHGKADYFRKADVIGCDVGFGVDVWVDREKWDQHKAEYNNGISMLPPQINRVPICVLLVG